MTLAAVAHLLTSNFPAVFVRVLAIEGGYADDPRDPGGRTLCGVSERYHPDFPFDDPTPGAVLDVWAGYWRREYEAPQILRLAPAVFGWALLDGHADAHIGLQRAADRFVPGYLVVDGILGPVTMGCLSQIVKTHGAAALAGVYRDVWLAHLDARVVRDPDKLRYLDGWRNRAVALTAPEVGL